MSIRPVLAVDEKSQIQALDRTQPGPADEKTTRRYREPRLQAACSRHSLSLRPMHEASSSSGLRPLPQLTREAEASLQAPNLVAAKRSTWQFHGAKLQYVPEF
jgi:hypothetical protein